MANGVARALTKRGLQRGDRVAILAAQPRRIYRRLITASCAQASSPCRLISNSRARPFISSSATRAQNLCSGDATRAPDCPPDIPSVTFGADFDALFIDPGPLEKPLSRTRTSRECSSTRRDRTGIPKGVVLSVHQSFNIWVVETRLAPDLDRHRYLIAAPPYHMNALALSLPALAPGRTPPSCCCRSSPRAPISRRSSAIACTWLTAVPPMIAIDASQSTTLLAHADISSASNSSAWARRR